MKQPRLLAITLAWVALLLTALGGWSDILNTGTLSSEHLRTDGLFLLGLATFLLVMYRN